MGVDVQSIVPGDREALLATIDLLLEHHKVVGLAPINPYKMRDSLCEFLSQGLSLLAMVEGKPAGVVVIIETSFWYSDQTFLKDMSLYVRPEFQSKGVFKALLRAFQAEAARRGLPAYISILNPTRVRPSKTPKFHAEYAGFVPLGYAMKLGGDPDGLLRRRAENDQSNDDTGLAGERQPGQRQSG